jgi:hypothetical protein
MKKIIVNLHNYCKIIEYRMLKYQINQHKFYHHNIIYNVNNKMYWYIVEVITTNKIVLLL